MRELRATLDAILKWCDAPPTPTAWTYIASADDLGREAEVVAARVEAGESLPLCGMTFAVKDNIDVAGVPTTAGAPAFEYTPAVDATVVARARAAGAIFVGKTNLDQFATGLSGTRSAHFGVVPNPHDDRFVAGGSSSGSAVTVADGLVDFAFGTDTAGSGRVPAACCGIVGLKPTRDRLSTRGVVPACPSFDCVSLFGRSIATAATAYQALTPDVSTARLFAEPTRVGVPIELEWFGDDDAARQFEIAVERLAAMGVTTVPIDVAAMVQVGALLYESALVAERDASFGEFVRAHPNEVDPAVRTVVAAADGFTATDAFRARAALRDAQARTASTWDRVDAIALPTIARHPTIDEALHDSIGTSRRLGTYTNFVNLLGLAAVAVPAGARSNGLPFGITFVAPPATDDALLALGARFLAEPAPPVRPTDLRIAVAGAHLRGQPLNSQLTALGARFVATTTTSADYRLFDLGLDPPKPGLVRDPGLGAPIEVEVWALDADALGRFVAAIPSPLGIAKVELADGSLVSGFACERHALHGATDITAHGGWRAYLATRS